MSLPTPVPLRKNKKIIPKDELMFWVENNVNTDGANIVQIRDAHLWTVGDYERHRLDVFEKHYAEGEGEFCWTYRIAERSYFLHYNPTTKTIEDKTLGRYVDSKKGIF
jgi:hypothetical protein